VLTSDLMQRDDSLDAAVARLRPRSHVSRLAYPLLTAGTGIPAILRFTEPRKFQLVK
jgi:hypothetical protein